MADSSSAVGELFKAKAVTDEQVSEAAGRYLGDPKAGAHPITNGCVFDLAAAVTGHAWACQVVASPEPSMTLKRGAIRTAFLLARSMPTG